MSAAYLVITLPKQSDIPEIQIKIFLSYLQPSALLSYLKEEGIHVSNKYVSKKTLVDMVVNGELMETVYTEEDNNLPPAKIYELILEKLNNVITTPSKNQ